MFADGPLKDSGAAAGFALVAVGLILGFVFVLPLARFREAVVAFQGLRNILGTCLIGFTLIGSIMIFNHSDKFKDPSYVDLGVLSVVDCVVFGAAFYSGSPVAYWMAMFWFSYIQIFFMENALNVKPHVLVAGMTFCWIGHVLMIVANLFFPPDLEGRTTAEADPADYKPTAAA